MMFSVVSIIIGSMELKASTKQYKQGRDDTVAYTRVISTLDTSYDGLKVCRRARTIHT